MVSYKALKTLAAGSLLAIAVGAGIGETANYEGRSLPRTNDSQYFEKRAEYTKKEINGWYLLDAGLISAVSVMGMFMRKSRLEDKAIAEHDDLKEVFD